MKQMYYLCITNQLNHTAMCLNLKNDKTRVQIAKKDIIVYKGLYKLNEEAFTFSKAKHGDSFKGTIRNTKCEGKISIENENVIFLCTNKVILDGNDAEDKLGYKYSWRFDNNVQEIIIDKEIIFNKDNYEKCIENEEYETPYQRTRIKIGETYTSNLIKNITNPLYCKIDIGLHSFKTMEDAKAIAPIIAKCIIPKGGKYYKGKFNDWVSYASDKLTYVEIVK